MFAHVTHFDWAIATNFAAVALVGLIASRRPHPARKVGIARTYHAIRPFDWERDL